MECFRQIFRCIKSPFRRNSGARTLEIGAPTNFRKEELPPLFSDDDTLASNCHRSEKGAVITAFESQPSTREKIRHQVRRMSVKLPHPQPESGESQSDTPDDQKPCLEPAGES